MLLYGVITSYILSTSILTDKTLMKNWEYENTSIIETCKIIRSDQVTNNQNFNANFYPDHPSNFDDSFFEQWYVFSRCLM